MLPVMMADTSLRISPKRFEATTTSNVCGRRMKFIAAASTSSDSVSTSGYCDATLWNVRSGQRDGPTTSPKAKTAPMVGCLSRDGRTVYLMSYAPPDARLGAYDAVTGADRFPD